MNTALADARARALETALAREVALQNHLEQQRLEIESEASRAQDSAASFLTCNAASEQVLKALDTLNTVVQNSMDSISNAINVHDTEANAANKMTTTAEVKNVWHGLIQVLEGLTPHITSTTTSTKSHILHTSDQVNTHKFLAECTQRSIATLDASLDSIVTSIGFKRSGLFRIPDEVFRMIFQLSVEDERRKLRAMFGSPRKISSELEHMKGTIPNCPFTLAAVSRRWRDIALNSPKLWSFIRVYTAHNTNKKPIRRRWIGKAAFDWSLLRAKATPIELIFYQDPSNLTSNPPNIPSNSCVSTIYLVRSRCIPQWLPPCLHLSVFGVSSFLWGVDFPPSLDGPKEISCTNIHPTFLGSSASTTFNFHSESAFEIPYIDHLCEKLPKLEHLQVLLPDAPAPPTYSSSDRTWTSLVTLCVTSSVLPHLAPYAHQRLLFPSLTTLILAEVFNSFSPDECHRMKPLLRTLTSLEIRSVSPLVNPSKLRVFIDWMEELQNVTLRRSAERTTVEALRISPAKLVNRLIIEGTVLEGVGLRDYTTILARSDSIGPGDSIKMEDIPWR
jgi:hypothetical protein